MRYEALIFNVIGSREFGGNFQKIYLRMKEVKMWHFTGCPRKFPQS